ncbi:hypothetical protein CJA_0738 [Cellvibrio japonicus Ueda107]|uniref:Uncharacterized protein n=1 Tax=Cellvibrio japonicus (strain Ueda107) TaxID=498211 RepID=B3PK76_CELJU|nr:hypothetical protein CJA_0738 [Cellvibrio japonicus Ueda107]
MLFIVAVDNLAQLAAPLFLFYFLLLFPPNLI